MEHEEEMQDMVHSSSEYTDRWLCGHVKSDDDGILFERMVPAFPVYRVFTSVAGKQILGG